MGASVPDLELTVKQDGVSSITGDCGENGGTKLAPMGILCVGILPWGRLKNP